MLRDLRSNFSDYLSSYQLKESLDLFINLTDSMDNFHAGKLDLITVEGLSLDQAFFELSNILLQDKEWKKGGRILGAMLRQIHVRET